MYADLTSREITRWLAFYNMRLGFTKPPVDKEKLSRFYEGFFKGIAKAQEGK